MALRMRQTHMLSRILGRFDRKFGAAQAARSLVVSSMPKPRMAGFLEKVKECNKGVGCEHLYIPFSVEDKVVGYLKPPFADKLLSFSDVFMECTTNTGKCVSLVPKLGSADERTAAVSGVLQSLREEGMIRGWRGEFYPVVESFHSEPALLVERAASPYFGFKAYGVHINGYVDTPEGLKLWVARRSRTKQTYPGKLDHIVAGGQPHGISCRDNVIKECQEEASMPQELASTARPVGAVSYLSVNEDGLKRDVLFCYDIKLPPDFTPVPQDGEVEEFFLKPIEWVMDTIANTSEFKTNCCLVLLDFLVRHGYITPEQPGYLDLVRGLRSGDCS